MSYGKMSTLVDIVKPTITTDEDGFRITTDEVLATVRAYRNLFSQRIWLSCAVKKGLRSPLWKT